MSEQHVPKFENVILELTYHDALMLVIFLDSVQHTPRVIHRDGGKMRGILKSVADRIYNDIIAQDQPEKEPIYRAIRAIGVKDPT